MRDYNCLSMEFDQLLMRCGHRRHIIWLNWQCFGDADALHCTDDDDRLTVNSGTDHHHKNSETLAFAINFRNNKFSHCFDSLPLDAYISLPLDAYIWFNKRVLNSVYRNNQLLTRHERSRYRLFLWIKIRASSLCVTIAKSVRNEKQVIIWFWIA